MSVSVLSYFFKFFEYLTKIDESYRDVILDLLFRLTLNEFNSTEASKFGKSYLKKKQIQFSFYLNNLLHFQKSIKLRKIYRLSEHSDIDAGFCVLDSNEFLHLLLRSLVLYYVFMQIEIPQRLIRIVIFIYQITSVSDLIGTIFEKKLLKCVKGNFQKN